MGGGQKAKCFSEKKKKKKGCVTVISKTALEKFGSDSMSHQNW